MTYMNINEQVKRQYHIESGKYWNPKYMGSTIYAFTMKDFEALESFKGFLTELGMKIDSVYKMTVYAK